MTALIAGVILDAGLGAFHHVGMIMIRRRMPSAKNGSQLAMLAAFCSLLVLHTLEILIFAAIYRGLIASASVEMLGPKFDGTWSALVYFSGMNFVTLGYANFEAAGPARILAMMESLGGFMVLTWSATFIYSISQALWDRSGD